MSKRPVALLIEDILEAVKKVERYTDEHYLWRYLHAGNACPKMGSPCSMASLTLHRCFLDFHALGCTPCSRARIDGKKRKPIRLG